MSVEGQVLGASTVAGGGAAAASVLVDTGNPAVIGVVVGVVMIVALGFIARASQRN